jgi:hypothetical protein
VRPASRRGARAVVVGIVVAAFVAGTPAASSAAFTRSAAGAASFHAATLAPPTGFVASTTCALSWTATTSTWADGYRIERWRNGTLEQTYTVTPATATSFTEHGLVLATYTWRIWAYKGAWTSSIASSTATIVLCL